MNSTAPPRYERAPAEVTSFTAFQPRLRELSAEFPDMAATVLAERVGWEGSSSWFRENVARLRPEQRRPDPVDRLVWAPGDVAQCDLWFPPKRIPLETELAVTKRANELLKEGAAQKAVRGLNETRFLGHLIARETV